MWWISKSQRLIGCMEGDWQSVVALGSGKNREDVGVNCSRHEASSKGSANGVSAGRGLGWTPGTGQCVLRCVSLPTPSRTTLSSCWLWRS